MQGRSKAISVRYNIDIIFILFLVCVFVVCSLFIILYGGEVYKNIQYHADSNHSNRVSVSYITNKVHMYDKSGCVSVYDAGDGIKALMLTDKGSKSDSYTLIYLYDGMIMECYIDDLKYFDPKYGEDIIEADEFEVALKGGGISIKTTDSYGKTTEYTVALRSGPVKAS